MCFLDQKARQKALFLSAVGLVFCVYVGQVSVRGGVQEQTVQEAEAEVAAEQELPDLLAMSFEDLMEMEVTTASKKAEKVQEAPAVMTVITARDMARFGGVNLMDVLERAGHLYPINSYMYRQNTASIRGIATTHHNKHTLILINGRPLRESLEGGADFPIFQAFPLEMIEKIEIIRGPGSVLYGTNAFAGVINIITKKSSDAELELSSHYGSFKTTYSSVVGGITKDDLQLYAGLKYLDSAGWRMEAVGEPPPGPPGPGPTSLYGHYDQTQLGGMFYLGYKGLTFNTFYANSDQTIVGAIGIPPFGPYRYDKLFMDVGYTHDIQDNWDISFNTTYNLRRSEFPYPTGPEVGKEVNTDDYLFELTTRLAPTEKTNIVAGGTVYYQSGINTLLDPGAGVEPDQIPEYSNVWTSGYFQADYKPTEELKFIGGVQANKVESQNWDFVPRAGAIANFTDNIGAKLLYGQAYRSPYAVETTLDAPGALIGDPSLEAEKIKTFDGQIFYSSEKVELSLTGFHSKLDKMISMVPSSDPAYRVTYANTGKLTVYGAELEGKYKPASSLYFTGSVTYQKSKDDDDVEDVTHIPNMMIKTGVYWNPMPEVSLGVFNSYYSKPSDIYDVNPSVLQVNPDPDSYSWLTANLRIDLTELLNLQQSKVELNVFAKNLLDEEVYMPEIYRKVINSVPGRSGRFIGAGLKVRF